MSVSITSASAPASTSKRYKTTKKKLTSVAKTVKPKAKATTTQKKLTSKAKTAQPKAKAPLSRPSWKDIIRECIAAKTEDARQGVSRNTIKKYAEEAYKIEISGLSLSQLNRAITSGTEAGIFVLPKGPSGKIKLAPKTKPLTSASKENSMPTAPKKVLAKTKVTAPSKRGIAAKQTKAMPTKKVSAVVRNGDAAKRLR